MTAGAHSQPPRSIASATARASASLSPPRSSSKMRAALASVTHSSAGRRGRSMPNAPASPRGVGTQKLAGRTKANSSSRSSAGNTGTSSRRAVALAWHSIGGGSCSIRLRASAGASASISPSGVSHSTSRKPATRAGACGTSTRGGETPLYPADMIRQGLPYLRMATEFGLWPRVGSATAMMKNWRNYKVNCMNIRL